MTVQAIRKDDIDQLRRELAEAIDRGHMLSLRELQSRQEIKRLRRVADAALAALHRELHFPPSLPSSDAS